MPEINQSLTAGTLVGHYRIEERLGEGGFGMTYRAQDLKLQRRVAIKEFIPVEFALRGADANTVRPRSRLVKQYRYGLDRFLDEARTLARFDHINIVRVYGYVEANNTAYLVMAFEHGETLEDYLHRKKFLIETKLVSIARSVFRGLKEIHRHEYLHRDIKPSNVYLRSNGEAVLIDFGAARQALGHYTRSLTGIVSPGYAPSEQYGNDPNKQGPWTDLYAVGAMLYRCVAATSPVDATNRLYSLIEERKDPLVPAVEIAAGRYSPKWLQLIDWLLCPAGKDRPQSVDEVLDWLDNHGDTRVKVSPVPTQKTQLLGDMPPADPLPLMPRLIADDRPFRTKQVTLSRKKSWLKNVPRIASSSGTWIAAAFIVASVLEYKLWAWLNTDQPAKAATQSQGALLVKTDPSDAKIVFRDGKYQYRPGMKLDAGHYGLEISHEGYNPTFLEVPINAEELHRANVKLTRLKVIKPQQPTVRRPPRIATVPKMVKIDAGCFQMGSPPEEAHRSRTERVHQVCVKSFNLGKYEVTVKEFSQFVNATGYQTDAERGLGGKGCYSYSNRSRQNGWYLRKESNWRTPNQIDKISDTHPATCISWNDANAYIRWLNRESGKEYRLPSEAEWEYAARAGSQDASIWGDDPKKACAYVNAADHKTVGQLEGWNANNCEDGYAFVAPVGNFPHNSYGLYDMQGNLYEWTCSGVDLSYSGGESACDPRATVRHILRGGSWADPPETLRIAYRGRDSSAFRSDMVGFRLAL